MVQLKEIKKEINFEEIYLYLNKGFINSTNQTWFKNINQIPPGSYLVMDRKNIETKKVIINLRIILTKIKIILKFHSNKH